MGGGREGIRNGMDGVEGRERGGFIGRWWIGGFARGFGLAGWIGGDEEQPRSQDDSVVAQLYLYGGLGFALSCARSILRNICVGSGWGQPALPLPMHKSAGARVCDLMRVFFTDRSDETAALRFRQTRQI